MPGFSIRNPYFIIVICLMLLVIGVTSISRMPVDLFPPINLPEVVVATFYSGMPPQDIETDITDPDQPPVSAVVAGVADGRAVLEITCSSTAPARS